MLAVESKVAAGNGRVPPPESIRSWKQIVEPVEPFLEAVGARLAHQVNEFDPALAQCLASNVGAAPECGHRFLAEPLRTLDA